MAEQSSSVLPVVVADSARPRTRMWLAVALLVLVLIPTASCAAFGVGLAMLSNPGAKAPLRPSVGVIRISGTIVSGSAPSLGGQTAASDTIIDLIQQAADDDNIRAVVLRVESPGGEVVASDEIHHALTQLGKPLVVSMGGLAASGGYYVSASADYIYATPNTLTGSIGVISQFVIAKDLLDNVGIDIIVVTAGDVKDFGSFHRDMTPEEREYWQTLINQTHEDFIDVVAEGRGMDVEAVRQLADGRVFRGEEAVDLGLVDEVGYFEDAVQKAADLAGIEGAPNVVELTYPVSFWDSLYGLRSSPRLTSDLELIVRDLALPSLEFRWLGH
jgi:protease-4